MVQHRNTSMFALIFVLPGIGVILDLFLAVSLSFLTFSLSLSFPSYLSIIVSLTLSLCLSISCFLSVSTSIYTDFVSI